MNAFSFVRFHFLTWGLLLMLLGTACSKYPDGPSFSLTSKTERVSNNWNAVSVFRNDIDRTSLYDVYRMDFNKNGRLTWTVQESAGPEATINANWELASNNRQVKLTFDQPDPNTGETRLLYLDILRLKETEMWVEFLTDGDEYQLRLE